MSAATRIAAPYAKSLMDLARDRGEIETVTKDIEHFGTAAKNRDFALLLDSPIVTADKKVRVMDALFGGYSEITSKFLRIVVSKGREAALPEIAAEFMRLYRLERHISQVKITSAAKLDDATIERIKAKLKAGGLIEDNVELEEVIDPELLGGFVLEVGDRLYDASARHQLQTLRKEFTDSSYQRNIR